MPLQLAAPWFARSVLLMQWSSSVHLCDRWMDAAWRCAALHCGRLSPFVCSFPFAAAAVCAALRVCLQWLRTMSGGATWRRATETSQPSGAQRRSTIRHTRCQRRVAAALPLGSPRPRPLRRLADVWMKTSASTQFRQPVCGIEKEKSGESFCVFGSRQLRMVEPQEDFKFRKILNDRETRSACSEG